MTSVWPVLNQQLNNQEWNQCQIVELVILIVSANKIYFGCLIELQRAVIDKYVEPKDRSLGKIRKHFRGMANIQGVTGGTDQTSRDCSLGQTIPI